MNLESIIENSMISLMETSSVDSITVNQVLEKADVSKASFYRHYLDKFDLINAIFDHIIPSEINQVGKTIEFSEFLLVLFDVFGKNRDFLKEAYKSEDVNDLTHHTFKFFKTFLTDFLTRKGADVEGIEINTGILFFALSLNSFLIKWIDHGGEGTIYNNVKTICNNAPQTIYPYLD